jgi:hypothetical protein
LSMFSRVPIAGGRDCGVPVMADNHAAHAGATKARESALWATPTEYTHKPSSARGSMQHTLSLSLS